MIKKLVKYVWLMLILLSFTGCSNTDLNDKEDSFFDGTELLSIVDTEDLELNDEMDSETEQMDSEKAVDDTTTNPSTNTEATNTETTNTETTNTEAANNTTTSKPTTNTETTNKNPDQSTDSSESTSTVTNNNSSNSEETLTPETSREAFELINAERVKLGLEPAVWDAECERIALIRGEEIAPYAIPEHDGFLKFQNENRKLCECLAWGYLTAEGVVNGWMNSSAHKNILMDPQYTKLAVVRVGNKWVAVNSR